jgi:phosphoribosylanthranilate isomerase
MTWIKICGITSVRDAEHAVACGASAIGLIFAPSKREVTAVQALPIARAVRGRAEIVGVFKDSAIAASVNNAVGLDRAQIHDRGTVRLPIPVMRAVRPEDLGPGVHNPSGETTLIDGSEGRGIAFDWNLATGLPQPFVLAGGLTPENVLRAIEIARPFGVDVTSGVEASPGVKDPDKVRRFCDAVRSADVR